MGPVKLLMMSVLARLSIEDYALAASDSMHTHTSSASSQFLPIPELNGDT